MKKPVFEGLATAIVTPFKNGTIDIPTFEMLLDTCLLYTSPSPRDS